ncbi:class I glutamine amidotransferase-like protein [Chaetomium strumarium]|uniref:Class I glutamine amidotransferase-like protein n=1 Tax=Chaetomium strumarium TaxID=1170767 RepID=A0AAJ0M2U5_9PEZI|nr:class I glutamine amidotransferase-like protein [Chaetomium strumarium]
MDTKTSAVADEPIQVLFALHDGFDLMDFAGPCEVLTTALHDSKDPTSKAFEITIAGGESQDKLQVLSDQGVLINSHVTWDEAHKRLKEFDTLIVVGGSSDKVLKNNAEPLNLISAYKTLQEDDVSRERTLLSVCTGALFLAKQAILPGLHATTHPDYFIKFENLCAEVTKRDLSDHTTLNEEARYVVNNLRFPVEDEDQSPYIRRKSDAGRRPSNARKGSMSFKNASRRESIARRQEMRLGGLRVITSGGVASGMDAALYLVSILVSEESANEVARLMQLTWTKGVVVDGIDV